MSAAPVAAAPVLATPVVVAPVVALSSCNVTAAPAVHLLISASLRLMTSLMFLVFLLGFISLLLMVFPSVLASLLLASPEVPVAVYT